MKRAICLICILMIAGFGAGNAFAASSKCTVVKVEGTQMVIECDKKTDKFVEGGKIKIKTVNTKAIEGC